MRLYPLLPELFVDNPWRYVPDGYRPAAAMYRRHYSCYQYADTRRNNPFNRARNLFVGPGEKMPLMTPNDDALFVWRKFIDDSGQIGVNCAVFRNESNRLSSDLIRYACDIAWMRWPGERLYTYVDPSRIRRHNKRHRKARPPGYCFLMAGWESAGETKSGKLILANEGTM